MKVEQAGKKTVEDEKRFDVPRRSPRWVMPLVKTMVLLSHVAITIFAFILAFKLRHAHTVLSATAWAWSKEFVPYSGILFFVVTSRLALFKYQQIYRFHGPFSYTIEATKIFKAVSVSSLLTVAWAFLFRGGFAFRDFSYSRSVFVFDFVIALAVFGAFHMALRYLQKRFRKHGFNLIPTLVVGTNTEAEQTIRELQERTDLGFCVNGALANDENETKGDLRLDIGTPVIGNLRDLPKVVRRLGIKEVIITDNNFAGEKLFESMMQIGRQHRVEFRFAPKLFNILPQKTSVEQIGVLPMVRLFREPLTEIERFFKRVSDLIIVVLATLVSFPFWLLVSVLIKLDSPGPILFKQERVGMDGRLFLCYKFRTMMTGVGDRLHREMYQKNIEGLLDANASGKDMPVYGKVKDDPRITSVGKWLRRTSFDELPQVLNVFRGEMSIVGPRPPIPYEVEEYDIWHRKRLDMKPGITGLWQVSGRNRLTFEEMVKFDLFYIENWSLLLDMKIVFLTLPAVFRGDGAK